MFLSLTLHQPQFSVSNVPEEYHNFADIFSES